MSIDPQKIYGEKKPLVTEPKVFDHEGPFIKYAPFFGFFDYPSPRKVILMLVLSLTVRNGMMHAIPDHPLIPYLKCYALHERPLNTGDQSYCWHTETVRLVIFA